MRLLPARLRPMLRVEAVVLLVVAWLLAAMNGAWWGAVTDGRSWADPWSWAFVACLFTVLVALHFALIAPLANRWTLRPLLSVLVVASATAAWYMRSYAVLMDPSMIRNVFATDVHEARELLSWSLVGWVLLMSAPPIALLWWVRIERRPWPQALAMRVFSVLGALAIGVLTLLPVNRDLTSMMRNHRELRYLITPGNFLYGLATYSARGVREAGVARTPVGTDARLVRVALAPGKHRVFVLVIGETARAANFSLLGYERLTTPELARRNVTGFRDVASCGTSTEVSVPCLFSEWGRSDYDERRIRHSEGLLDVLSRAGYAVKWFDNQSGCKGVCRGSDIHYEKLGPAQAPDLCRGDECYDGILLRRLRAELASLRQDMVIVLHMMGNHGPAYFRRYPAEFRRFSPDCATAELRDCTRQQVLNSYDNAIAYTDHVLAGIVDTLAEHATALDTAMLYVSDHGESLGENGLYLHGLPYAIAPRTQTRVPLITWLSAEFARHQGVDVHCLAAHVDDELSHDNVFHSVLGLLDVQTTAYRQDRDLFANCRHAPRGTFARQATP